MLVRGMRPQGQCEREEQYSLCLVHLAEVSLLFSDRPLDRSPDASIVTMNEDTEVARPESINNVIVAGGGEGGGGGGVAADTSLVETKTEIDPDPALDPPPDGSLSLSLPLPPEDGNSHVLDLHLAPTRNPDKGSTRKKKSRQKARRAVGTAAKVESLPSLVGSVPSKQSPSASHSDGYGASYSDDHGDGHGGAYLQQRSPALLALGSVSGSEVSMELDLGPVAPHLHPGTAVIPEAASTPLSVSVSLTEDTDQDQNQNQNQCEESDPYPISSFSFASMFSDVLTKKRVEITE
jgi:hypothetical protein